MKKVCGCCEGLDKLTPIVIANRPGLNSLTYRVGTHASFLETMKACLTGFYLEIPGSNGEIKRIYPLKSLTARDSRDPAIAFLDAWATVADVLTFYQERIANEGFLRTATERRSILELARLVGYRLRPGVAATVYPAFTLEDGYKVEIPLGTRAQSTPGPGELPQSFETFEPLPARSDWNVIKPRMTRPQHITEDNAQIINTLYFDGISTNLQPNNKLLFVFEETDQQVLRSVESVEPQNAVDYTIVTLLQQTKRWTVNDFINAVQDIIERYLQLESYCVAASEQMALNVVGILEKLRESLVPPSESPPSDFLGLMALIEDTHNKLYDIYNEVSGRFVRLKLWLRGMINELGDILENLTQLAGGSLSRAGISRLESPSIAPIKPETVELNNLIPALILPPSLQPANANQLVRENQKIFAEEADITPRILTSIYQKTRDTLYKAWANANVTPASALTSVNAFRTKATPFGHNAPLRPVYGDDGKVVDFEEWELVEIGGLLKVRLFSTDNQELHVLQWFRRRYSLENGSPPEFPPLGLDISIRGDGVADTHRSFLAEFTRNDMSPDEHVYVDDFLLGDFTVRVTVEYVDQATGRWGLGNITVEFLRSRESSSRESTRMLIQSIPQIVIESSHRSELGLVIQINSDQPRQLAEGDIEKYSINNRKVVMSLDESLRVSHLVPAFATEAQYRTITLDTEYAQIIPNSWVVIERVDQTDPVITRVDQVETVSRADYGISAKATRLLVKDRWLFPEDASLSVLRGTTVYAQSESLLRAEEPITGYVAGDNIELDALYDGLEAGRWVIVSGERVDIPGTSGVTASELVMVAGVTHGVQQIGANRTDPLPGDKQHTTIQLAESLAYCYKRDTVTIYGNVVKATHGETRTEVLGAGDGTKSFQKFTLSHSPLTYVAATTPSGIESTLEARVNDVLWLESESFVGLGSTDRGYITKTDNEHKTSLVFGDGKHGARLPTGVGNISATYRSGIGKAGNVASKQISLLASKPLGVKEVINPLPATGGADPEDRDQARHNTPVALTALDRLVSVQDYADFSRTFAGIAKAVSSFLSDGRRQIVHITIAGTDDIPIDENSDLYRNLLQALRQFGEPNQALQVDLRVLKMLICIAKVKVMPGYLWEKVEPVVSAALLDAFSFEQRELGQDVTLSEVQSIIQQIPGVKYVDVDVLSSVSEIEAGDPEKLKVKLQALAKPGDDQPAKRVTVSPAPTRTQDGRIFPAELAYFKPDIPDTLILTELKNE
jgi:predicted phage baseplate assembly protein